MYFSMNLSTILLKHLKQMDCLLGGDILSLESLEGCHADVCDQGVEFVHAVLVLVTETSKTDAHTEGNILDSLRPEVLVESGVNPYVGGSHLLLGELLHLLDGTGGTVLESDAMEPLVKVDGVLTGHHLKMSVHTTPSWWILTSSLLAEPSLRFLVLLVSLKMGIGYG